MANEKFNKGPYSTEASVGTGYDPELYPLIINDADDWAIAAIIGDVEEVNAIANAYLFAAAPDLYKALEKITAHISAQCPWALSEPLNSIMKASIAALAKARGEQPEEEQEEDSPSDGDLLLDEMHANAPSPYDP